MSTITKGFTKEQLIARINQVTAINKYRISRDPDADGLAMDNELFAIALASLEAEVVAYIRDGFRADGVHFCGGIITAAEHERTKPALSDRYNWKHQPLYTAPPAPVSVPDEATPDNIQMLASTYAPRGVTYQWDSDECNAAADSWNACRAAMLQGAENSESPTTIQTAPALDSSPKIAESPSGNSPVIHEGWVSVSDQTPDEYDFDIWVFSPSKGVQDGVQWDGLEFADDEYQFRIKDVSHWMKKIYPAAPLQEVK